jgi:hypothetical protein
VNTEKTVEYLRKEHRCFSKRAIPCAFFGFEKSKELENKIYDFIDSSGNDWSFQQDAWDPIIDFFKKNGIDNVAISGNTGLMFHKIK